MIKILDGLYLDADDQSIKVVNIRYDEYGEEKERTYKYYNTLQSALNGCMRVAERRNVRAATDLKDLLALNQKNHNTIVGIAKTISPSIAL